MAETKAGDLLVKMGEMDADDDSLMVAAAKFNWAESEIVKSIATKTDVVAAFQYGIVVVRQSTMDDVSQFLTKMQEQAKNVGETADAKLAKTVKKFAKSLVEAMVYCQQSVPTSFDVSAIPAPKADDRNWGDEDYPWDGAEGSFGDRSSSLPMKLSAGMKINPFLYIRDIMDPKVRVFET